MFFRKLFGPRVKAGDGDGELRARYDLCCTVHRTLSEFLKNSQEANKSMMKMMDRFYQVAKDFDCFARCVRDSNSSLEGLAAQEVNGPVLHSHIHHRSDDTTGQDTAMHDAASTQLRLQTLTTQLVHNMFSVQTGEPRKVFVNAMHAEVQQCLDQTLKKLQAVMRLGKQALATERKSLRAIAAVKQKRDRYLSKGLALTESKTYGSLSSAEQQAQLRSTRCRIDFDDAYAHFVEVDLVEAERAYLAFLDADNAYMLRFLIVLSNAAPCGGTALHSLLQTVRREREETSSARGVRRVAYSTDALHVARLLDQLDEAAATTTSTTAGNAAAEAESGRGTRSNATHLWSARTGPSQMQRRRSHEPTMSLSEDEVNNNSPTTATSNGVGISRAQQQQQQQYEQRLTNTNGNGAVTLYRKSDEAALPPQPPTTRAHDDFASAITAGGATSGTRGTAHDMLRRYNDDENSDEAGVTCQPAAAVRDSFAAATLGGAAVNETVTSAPTVLQHEHDTPRNGHATPTPTPQRPASMAPRQESTVLTPHRAPMRPAPHTTNNSSSHSRGAAAVVGGSSNDRSEQHATISIHTTSPQPPTRITPSLSPNWNTPSRLDGRETTATDVAVMGNGDDNTPSSHAAAARPPMWPYSAQQQQQQQSQLPQQNSQMSDPLHERTATAPDESPERPSDVLESDVRVSCRPQAVS